MKSVTRMLYLELYRMQYLSVHCSYIYLERVHYKKTNFVYEYDFLSS